MISQAASRALNLAESAASATVKAVTDYYDPQSTALKATRKSLPTDPVHRPMTYHINTTKPILHDEFTFNETEEKLDPTFSFFVLGCIGEKGPAQKDVAKMMDRIAENNKPDFIIFLGDQFYEHGASSPTDPVFKQQFEDIYQSPELTVLRNIPCFLIAGNHCHNIFRFGGDRGWNIDFQRIEAQIKHTFFTNGEKDSAKEMLYEQVQLDLSTLQPWNMPRRFYKLIYKTVELYFLDTNTYVRDYLNHITNIAAGKIDPDNQAAWLETEMKKNSDAIKLGFHHHSRMTVGKRYNKDKGSDHDLYLTFDEIKNLEGLGIIGNYNQIIDQIFRKQGFNFTANYSAHDHNMYYYVDHNVCQVVSGGGGGKLQERHLFSNSNMIPCFLKEYGFVRATINPSAKNELQVVHDFLTVLEHQLQFSSTSVMPLRRYPLTEPEIDLDKVYLALLEASHQFLNQTSTYSGIFTSVSNIMKKTLKPEQISDFINFLNAYEGFRAIEVAAVLNELLNFDCDGIFAKLIEASFTKNNINSTLKEFQARFTRKLISSIPTASGKLRKIPRPGFASPKSPVMFSVKHSRTFTFTVQSAVAQLSPPMSHHKNQPNAAADPAAAMTDSGYLCVDEPAVNSDTGLVCRAPQ